MTGADGAAGRTCAALDLGTSNCRLLIARPRGRYFRVVDSFSRIVRLGENLAASGCLSEAAMARALDALRVCAHKIARRRVAAVRAVATEACRRAANGGQFVDRVAEETGLKFEIISPQAEAELAARGCVTLITAHQRRAGIDHGVLFDIGGGSSQVIFLRLTRAGFDILASHSIPWGVVTLSEHQAQAGCDFAAAREMIRDTLQPIEGRLGARRCIAEGRVAMVGTSGTVTTLAAVHAGLPHYDRCRIDGLAMAFDDIAAVSRRLGRLDLAARAAIGCVGPERADLVVAGCAILEAICETWPVGRLTVADRGLREGMLLDLMQAPVAAHA